MFQDKFRMKRKGRITILRHLIRKRTTNDDQHRKLIYLTRRKESISNRVISAKLPTKVCCQSRMIPCDEQVDSKEPGRDKSLFATASRLMKNVSQSENRHKTNSVRAKKTMLIFHNWRQSIGCCRIERCWFLVVFDFALGFFDQLDRSSFPFDLRVIGFSRWEGDFHDAFRELWRLCRPCCKSKSKRKQWIIRRIGSIDHKRNNTTHIGISYSDRTQARLVENRNERWSGWNIEKSQTNRCACRTNS